MNPLTSVPGNVRIWLYWLGYLLGVVSQGVTIIWGALAASSPEISMPTWLVIVSAVVAFAQTQLNLLAGANVIDTNAVVLQATVEPTGPHTADVTVQVPERDEAGRSDSTILFYATTVPVILVLIVAVLATLIGDLI